MKSWKKILPIFSFTALTIISCKNTNNNNNLLKFREINFDLKSSIPNSDNYTVNLDVTCQSDPVFQETQQISQANKTFKIAENSNCAVTINSIEYGLAPNIINLTPNDTSTSLTFHYNSNNSSTEIVTSHAVNFINSTSNTNYAMIKNSSSSIQLILTDSLKETNEISSNTITQNIIPSPEMNLFNIPAPDLVNFTLERKILKRNDNTIAAQTVTLKGPENLNLASICKVVSATEWEGKVHNWAETNALFNSSRKSCPVPNVSNNWNDFKVDDQYLIMSNTINNFEVNSYRVYKINKVN